MDTEIIQAEGTEILTEEQKQIVNRLLNEYYKRIKQQLKNLTSLEFHLKEYKKDGKGKKFSIHIKAIAPTTIFEGDASDWDLARTTHKALNKIMNEIEHKFHLNNHHFQIRKPQKRNSRKN